MLENFVHEMRPAVEVELRQVVDAYLTPDDGALREMMAYHLGWEGEGAGPEAQGKRIRPVLVLLCAAAGGNDWKQALPAAAAVELLHNFSLIHDDIQDESDLRRGRPTLWVKWGTAQAINAGDLMFTLAHLALLRSSGHLPDATVLHSAQVLQETCVRLTRGQYLDMSYEQVRVLPMEAYWPMVSGKTAALLGCCAELGGLAAGMSAERLLALRAFAEALGLAFQVQDDWLGIWGDSAHTGKSVESDLVTGKKTLPVLYALSRQGRFAQRWQQGPIAAAEVAQIAQWLTEEGAQEFTQQTADRLTNEALQALDRAACSQPAGAALYELAQGLLQRRH